MCKILGLFVNTLTADDKYSLLNRGILLQHLQMAILKTKNFLSIFFCTFCKSRLNFEHFQQKDDCHSSCIFELTDSEKRC